MSCSDRLQASRRELSANGYFDSSALSEAVTFVSTAVSAEGTFDGSELSAEGTR